MVTKMVWPSTLFKASSFVSHRSQSVILVWIGSARRGENGQRVFFRRSITKFKNVIVVNLYHQSIILLLMQLVIKPQHVRSFGERRTGPSTEPGFSQGSFRICIHDERQK